MAHGVVLYYGDP